jgi:hypothetical protein
MIVGAAAVPMLLLAGAASASESAPGGLLWVYGTSGTGGLGFDGAGNLAAVGRKS